MPVGSQNMISASGLTRFRPKRQNEMQNSSMLNFAFSVFFLSASLSSSIMPFFAFLKNIYRPVSLQAFFLKKSFLRIKSIFNHFFRINSFRLIHLLHRHLFSDIFLTSNYKVFSFRGIRYFKPGC